MAGENANLSIQDALRAVKAALDAAADGSAPLTVALDGITELGGVNVAGDLNGGNISDANIAGDASVATVETATFNAPPPYVVAKSYQATIDEQGVAFVLPAPAQAILVINDSADPVYLALASDNSANPPTAPGSPGSEFVETPLPISGGGTLYIDWITVGSIGFITNTGTTANVTLMAFWTEALPAE